jgi:glutamate formiminotransferase
VLECVVNLSEGRDLSVISAITAAGADHVLDVHNDHEHHRSVITLAGSATEEAVRAVARRTVELVDIGAHGGVHPRIGALDVVPFVPLRLDGSPVTASGDLGPALAARRRFAQWAGRELSLPCFYYGPERSLPELRRNAFVALEPDTGPARPHPSAGACAVGARFVLVAYNLWLSASDVEVAREIARELRGPAVRALGLAVGAGSQVSCNLVDPLYFGPAEAYDAVGRLAADRGVEITNAEVVGLVPAEVVAAVPKGRQRQLDLDPERTIEACLAAT